MTESAVILMQRLGLSDEELCATLDSNPIEVISGSLDHRPELPILLSLTQAAEEAVGEGILARWVRTSGPAGRPIDHLVTRDFVAFEAALGTLLERGFVIGG